MPAVNVVRQIYPTINAINILFLGDGFHGKNDHSRFENCVMEVTDLLFRNIDPFKRKRVREQFNVFSYYSESPSSGINCSVPIDVATGERHLLGEQNATGMLKDKESALGLHYSGKTPSIIPLPNKENIIPQLISSLFHPGPTENPPHGTAIPACWEDPTCYDPMNPYSGKDRGLVCVLVNDDVDGGTSNEVFVAITLGDKDAFHITENITVIHGVFHENGLQIFDHDPNSPRNRFNYIADVLAHEIGHSRFGLADEYAHFCTFPETVNSDVKKKEWEDICSSANNHPNVTADIENFKWRDAIMQVVWDYMKNNEGNFRFLFEHKDLNNDGIPKIALPKSGNRFRQNSRPTPPPKDLKIKGLCRLDIIGLYEEGFYQYRSIYRPAGRCKMRQTTGDWDKETKRYYQIPFCYVCRRAIVQRIDPSLLKILEKEEKKKWG
jgi:hypothetical protein